MESCELVLDIPKVLGLKYTPMAFKNNSSLVDKLEQSYFSKGFM
ncbi:MAG: hypothetical protein OEZ51_07360 [Nitrospinota bacterium]|nr:hypothetical protein [Nitrospinota bacterium]